ncbi:hypothetical protein A3H26_03025 [candidate division WWE3 bacterium RIFCSPLOWO2_12_FULL_36_10]|uniref:Cell envelope-related transcriptional attenuator domain-containing protein n=1 Tax=candidate division WWE3 bacterium RIFCSPLOWO2_12_FULL_36_10 TaxID=1802630 RepID=A0A1F4VJG4_UNCKA|nr:MAG: hypothetical protein A3H26_03025 [candidate division WWE3 bacterium RIFCSPLOWO2_12_FULL_36_10]
MNSMKYTNLALHKRKAENTGSVVVPKKKKLKAIIVFIVVLVALASVLIFGRGATAIFNPVSIVSNIVGFNLNDTDGRTNILILGSDKRSKGIVKSVLTDTILVSSIGTVEKNIALVSLPRDLWVEGSGGYHSKINAVYSYGNEKCPDCGAKEIKDVVEKVLGIPIHYYVVVDFQLFKESIDILGGIKVNVENSFEDKFYPVEGKENVSVIADRYETVKFQKGEQLMNGEAALKFVRSRKGNNGEDTDFERSKRQQKVILAIKDKFLSVRTLVDLPKMKQLYDSYAKNVDLNIDYSAARGFYLLSQKIDFGTFRTVVLDDRSTANQGGLLYAPEDNSLYGGAYVLIPRVGDYSQIHAYVQKYIFGE